LKKIKDRTDTPFTIAVDLNKEKTARYSPSRREFSGYVIDSTGTITKFFQGDLRNRAKSKELLAAINAASEGSGMKKGSAKKQGSDTKKEGSRTKKQGSSKKGSAKKKGSGTK